MTGRIVFLADEDQYAVWHSSAIDALPATGNFALLMRFRRESVPHLDLWSFLDEDSAAKNDKEAWSFCNRLATALGGGIRMGEADLVDLCRYDLLYSVRAVLNVGQAVSGVLASARPAEVVRFAEMAKPEYDVLPDGPPDLFNATTAFAVRRLHLRERVLQMTVNARQATSFKPQGRTVSCSGVRLPWPDHLAALCVAEGLGLDEQSMLYERVAQDHLNGWAAVVDAEGISQMPSLPLRYLRWLRFDCSAVNTMSSDFVERVTQLLRSPPFAKLAQLAEPEFSFLWESQRERFVLAASEYQMTRLAAIGWRPNIAITGCDIYGFGRCASRGWLDGGVPTLSVDHVGLGWSSTHRNHEGSRAHLAVWGDADARGRRSYRLPPARVEAVGSLRADLADQYAGGMIDDPAGPLVVFTSSTSFGALLDGWSHPAALAEAWDALVAGSVAARCRLLVKPHPRYDHPAFYEQLIADRDLDAAVVRGSAALALNGACAAVLMNTPSTVLVQIIAAGVPAIYFKHGVAACADPPLEGSGILIASSAGELEAVLCRLRSDGGFRAEVRQQQRNGLTELLAATGPAAAENLMRFARSVARPADEALPPDKSARWVLDVITTLNDLRRGALSYGSFKERVNHLAAVSPPPPAGLCVEAIAEVFLRIVVWGGWSRTGVVHRLLVLWRIRSLLPTRFRPPWRQTVGHIRALLRQARSSVP